MAGLPTSGIRLFRLFGIQVSLHWTWFIVAWIQLQRPFTHYTSPAWNLVEYISLFAIVLMHEFGHALACRSVGGKADFIMLWPLGGVAFVAPPPRPGAVLWSIAAGPLVNVALLPITLLAVHLAPTGPDLAVYFESLAWINGGLLVFNMLPIFPLDGGQILRSLLWFVMGPGRSLMVASIIGLIGAGVGMLLAMALGSIWLIILAAFAAIQSWAGFQQSRRIRFLTETPRRTDVRCPACGVPPMQAVRLMCVCRRPFDVFETDGRCPNCGVTATEIQCPDCGTVSHPATWRMPASVHVSTR
jgi:Zn-dependent protease